MAIPAGARLGPYEILSAIGAGGMGEVYRGRDSKLGRDVALKVLPPAFAADAERMARFEREARLLAALNHPNIAHIYGLEESSGTPVLVMELIEGPTLAERIAAGPIAIEEALPIARQIAEALEYAHERGVIHRDLKPANIKVTPEGTVKVLDFGLAKALTENPSTVDMSNSPTLSMGATMQGVILGTAAYMSPEQAKAKPADRRADIWAFGVVLCEMLTGKQLYSGETAAETLASVIKETPDLSPLPAGTPPAIRNLIARCLDKDPRERLQHIGEARIALAHAGEAAAAPPESTAAAPLRASKLPWAIAGAVTIVAIAASWIAYRDTRPVERASMYFTDDVGAEIALTGVEGPAVALSPDASRVAYLARSASGITRISVRQLDNSKAVELAGTDRADAPFFSPDGRWIGFFVGGALKKISVDGGAATTICETDGNPRGGGFWAEDGNIYISNMTTPVLRVPASGGKPAPVMPLGDGETTNRGAQVLPGGDAILFEASSDNNDWSTATIQVFDTRTKQRKTLVHGGFFPRYIHGVDPLHGHMLYMQGGSIFAAPMDIRGLDLTGPALLVLQNVSGRIPNGLAHIAVSESGAMIYVSGAAVSQTDSLAWLDSAGNTQPVSAPPGAYLVASLSPDGTRAALLVTISGGIDVYVLDLQSNRLTRLTFLKRVVSRPVWTPDGKHIAFAIASAELNGPGLYWVRSDGGAEPQLLVAGQNTYPGSFTPDEKHLVYREFQGTESAIWTLPLDAVDPEHPKPGKPELFLRSQTALIQNPVLSPDGRWLAYTSGDSASTNEVFVRPFTRPGGQWQVSTSGGFQPRWSQNARELAYLGGADGRQILVASYDAKDDSFSAGQPRLFGGSEKAGGVFAPATGFDISPDGKRILGMLPASGAAAAPETHISFLINYADELRRKVPADK